MKFNAIYLTLLGLAGTGLGFSNSAAASAITVNYQTLADTSHSNQALTATLNTAPQVLAVPDSITFSDTFHSQTPSIIGGPATGYGFIDTYVFTIGSAALSSLISTLNFGGFAINNFEERLYAFSGTPNLDKTGSLIQGTTTPIAGFPGSYVGLTANSLSAGTYALEVRGNVSDAFGGTYTGQLNLETVSTSGSTPVVANAPVPIPAAFWLMGSAFTGWFSFARKKS